MKTPRYLVRGVRSRGGAGGEGHCLGRSPALGFGLRRADGKYYLYFSLKDKNDVFHIGVAISGRPEGPFVPRESPIRGSYSIDPCVFRDDDGKHYILRRPVGRPTPAVSEQQEWVRVVWRRRGFPGSNPS
jgi:hypothetical protein